MIEALPTRDAWADACADRLAEALSAGLAENGRAAFAGAGGSTPAPIYERLSGAALDWSRVTVTLVDERHVPERSPDSNAALLKRTLLTGAAASARFIPLYRNAVTVDRAAYLAARELKAAAPRLDAVLLGMGEDGHIASMFPENPALKQLLALNNPPFVFHAPKSRSELAPPQDRLSLNLPWFRDARRVVLAITGRAKRAVFEREAGGDPGVSPIAALVASGAPLDVIWTEA